jgi:hypothetical protein
MRHFTSVNTSGCSESTIATMNHAFESRVQGLTDALHRKSFFVDTCLMKVIIESVDSSVRRDLEEGSLADVLRRNIPQAMPSC